MMMPDDYLKRSLRPVVFGGWTCTLFYLVVSQRYTAFLRPEFGILLALSLFIALGFAFSTILHVKVMHVDFPHVLRGLILLLPVIFLLVMPEAHLGKDVFKTRFTGSAAMPFDRQEEAQDSAPETANPPGPPARGREDTDSQIEAQGQTILEILLNPKSWEGRRVSFSGMIFRDENLKESFNGRDTLVYRFLINCCAADALPLSIVLDSAPAAAFENDQWVRVEGTFQLLRIHEKAVPFVDQASLKPIDPPKVPYLF
jgi:putative membrane protein